VNNCFQRHDSQQALALVENVDVVNGLHPLTGLAAQVRDRLVHRHVRSHAYEARAHEAAGIILGVREQGAHLPAVRFVQQSQQAFPLVLVALLENVSGVVGVQQTQPAAALRSGEGENQFCLVAGRQGEEELFRLHLVEEAKTFYPVLGGEHTPGIREVVGQRGDFGRFAGLRGHAAPSGAPRSLGRCLTVEQRTIARIRLAALGLGGREGWQARPVCTPMAGGCNHARSVRLSVGWQAPGRWRRTVEGDGWLLGSAEVAPDRPLGHQGGRRRTAGPRTSAFTGKIPGVGGG